MNPSSPPSSSPSPSASSGSVAPSSSSSSASSPSSPPSSSSSSPSPSSTIPGSFPPPQPRPLVSPVPASKCIPSGRGLNGTPTSLSSFFIVNRLKSTPHPVNFHESLKCLVTEGDFSAGDAHKALLRLSGAREEWHRFFFEQRNLDSVNRDQLISSTTRYLSFLLGLISCCGVASASTPSLRNVLPITWNNIVGVYQECTVKDVLFEVICVLENQGLWLMGYAEHLLNKKESEQNKIDANHRLAHDSLQKAAGIFDCAQSQIPGILYPSSLTSCSDLKSEFLTALRDIALSQAQEVTIMRAVRLGHNASLVAKLCVECLRLYTQAKAAIVSMDKDLAPARLHRLDLFLRFKMLSMESMAHYFHGISEFIRQKPGLAAAHLEYASTSMRKAHEQSVLFDALTPKLQTANAADALRPLVASFSQTSQQVSLENRTVYLDTVPPSATSLPLCESQSLVKSVPFSLPAGESVWQSIPSSAWNLAKAAQLSNPATNTNHSSTTCTVQ